MTISSTIAKHQYKGNGNTFIFPFSFRIWDKKQILVTITNSEGITNTIVPYAVTFTPKGGEVTLYLDNEKKIPFPKGYSIALTRNMPFLQESDYINGTRINSEVFEDNLDIATAERQQLLERVLSAITVPPTSSQTPDELWNDFIGNINFVKQALLAIQKAMANLFSQTIIPFTTKNNVFVYSVGEDIVLDPDANNLLLVMDHVVQQPDVAYFIKSNNTIQFKVNPGEGKKVWGISSLSFANPDIRAIVEKAIQKIVAEGNKQVTVVTNKGTEQIKFVQTEGTKQIKFVQTEGTKQINYAKEQATLAKAWAESPISPDEALPESKSSKTWALYAEERASELLELQVDCKISNDGVGNVIYDKEQHKLTIILPFDNSGSNQPKVILTDEVTLNRSDIAGSAKAIKTVNDFVGTVNTKAEANKTQLADKVSKTANESISGTKTFLVSPRIQDNKIDTGIIPTANLYTQINFLDKKNISLGHVGVVRESKGINRVEIVARQKNLGGKTGKALALWVKDDGSSWAIAPTVQANQIGDYIATTKWVRDYGQTVKSLATRTSTGQVTLTNVIPNKPLFIIQEKWNGWSDTKITPKRGIINCLTSVNKSFYLGGSQYLALYTQHNQALIFIPNETTVIFDTVLAQDVLLNFYQ